MCRGAAAAASSSVIRNVPLLAKVPHKVRGVDLAIGQQVRARFTVAAYRDHSHVPQNDGASS